MRPAAASAMPVNAGFTRRERAGEVRQAMRCRSASDVFAAGAAGHAALAMTISMSPARRLGRLAERHRAAPRRSRRRPPWRRGCCRHFFWLRLAPPRIVTSTRRLRENSAIEQPTPEPPPVTNAWRKGSWVELPSAT